MAQPLTSLSSVTLREKYLQEILELVKIIAQTRLGQEKNGNEITLFKGFADSV
jgi:hypothetical protein